MLIGSRILNLLYSELDTFAKNAAFRFILVIRLLMKWLIDTIEFPLAYDYDVIL
jgi:hypothetical protein